MSNLRTILSLLSASLVLATGCSNGSDHLRVRGEAALEVDGTFTGFAFDETTRLDEDVRAGSDGRLAGHCTLLPGASGEADALTVGISRRGGSSETGVGLRSFEARFEGSAAEVEAELGESTFTAQKTDMCRIEQLYVDMGDGRAGVLVDCALSDGDGHAAQAVAELHFSGCTIQ